MSERCGRVEPFWVRLGSIQWVGSPQPEPHYMIEYRRCPKEGTMIERKGFIGPLCPEHAK